MIAMFRVRRGRLGIKSTNERLAGGRAASNDANARKSKRGKSVLRVLGCWNPVHSRCASFAFVACYALASVPSWAAPTNKRYVSARAYEQALRGDLYLADGDFGAAVEAWRLARVYDPDSAAGALGLAEALWRRDAIGDGPRVDRALKDARRLAPGSAGPWLWSGRVALARGAVSKAERAFERARRHAADDRDGLAASVALAELWIARGERRRARRLLKKVEPLLAGDVQHGPDGAELLAELGAIGAASRLAAQLRTRAPRSIRVSALLAEIHGVQNQRALALAATRRDVARAPRDADTLLDALRAALRAGSGAQSAACLDALLALDEDGTHRLKAALVHLDERRADLAVPLLEALRRARPTDPLVVAAHARALAELGKRGSAVAALERVKPTVHGYVDARLQLADIHVAAGRHEQARAALVRARAHHPDHRGIVARLVDLHRAAGRNARALALLVTHRQSRGAAPALVRRELELTDDAPALAPVVASFDLDDVAELAAELVDAGRSDLAEPRLMSVLEGAPDHPVALVALAEARLMNGGVLSTVGDGLERLAGAGADDPRLLSALGATRLARGDVAGAIRALQRARAQAPGDAVLAERLGDARSKLGDHPGAAKAYRACALLVIRQLHERVPGAELRLASVARKRVR